MTRSGDRPWRLRVDTGGTFTDCLALAPDGRRLETKVLSHGALRAKVSRRVDARTIEVEADLALPVDFFAGYRLLALGRDAVAGVVASRGGRIELDGDLDLDTGEGIEMSAGEEAPVLAARLVTRTPLHEAMPPIELRLGTTRGTNALLQRKGARTALLVTRGFADVLAIGTQQRPELFALDARRPAPLPEVVVEVDERLDAQGNVLVALDTVAVEAQVAALDQQQIDAVAVAFLHAYRNAAHEEAVERMLRAAGFVHVSRSSAVAPFQKILERARTAVVDAYLSPVIDDYLRSIRTSLGRARLHVMTSAGGLVSGTQFRPKDSLLSGPAAGVVGAAAAGRAAGYDRILSLDMGGTSTDVARIDGDFEYVFEHRVGDAELFAPALAIETVAAGGGSICGVDHGRLVVGPQSAGAFPGSACYGAGGPLTLTDVNLLLGRLRPEKMPIPLDGEAARRRLREQADALRDSTGDDVAPEALLEGWLRIANERMAEAIRQVSLRRGYDPRDFALVAFGGAGGQHACAIAELLGIEAVVAPPSAGILSAWGLHHAALERFVQRQVLRPLSTVQTELPSWLAALEGEAVEAMAEEGVAREDVTVQRRLLEMRYEGQDATLAVDAGEDPGARFEAAHEDLFGHRPTGKRIELVALRVVARSLGTAAVDAPPPRRARDPRRPSTARVFSRGAWIDVPCLERAHLAPADACSGPCLVVEDHALFFVEAGWNARVDAHGAIVATTGAPGSPGAVDSAPAAVTLELFRHRFESIAREMGEHLRRSALSINIKERLDFSCALLDAGGRLVVNAPHIPVHLGALGLCVRRLREAMDLAPGDVVVTNHPAFGGSHLPDVTVVAPVEADGVRAGYVAVRAHHAEIGGITPGSMPPHATTLAEEGVVLPPLRVVCDGVADFEEVARRLREAPYPTRSLADNLADLRAMVAATQTGVRRLQRLAGAHGAAAIAGQMDALRQLARRHLTASLQEWTGSIHADDAMDDGSRLNVEVTFDGGTARIDFTHSAGVHPGNLNATEAIVRSAVLYVLRLLVREPLPLNEGLMEAVELILPPGMLNPPFRADAARCPAIVGGNVETSQRIVDVLLKAFGVVAASQGTMNNVSFGNASFGYYETMGGGAGAGPGFDGGSGVQVHMTNTRLTDAEVLEHRYPVRVRRLALRHGSGGAGRWRGGDGMVRELEFLAPVTLSVLTQRRDRGPYGLEGGGDGAPGAQRVLRTDGELVNLSALDRIELKAGDRFVIESPGGGGFGSPVTS